MRWAWRIGWILAGGMAVWSAAAHATAELVATRQSTFAIPFHVARARDPAQEPVEVRLYVSTDFGATWQLYEAVEPSEQRFLFRGHGDGQYWFLVRTLNRAGELFPRGGDQPELRVVVDTTPPRLHLEAHRGAAGEIVVRWEVVELNPKPDSLTIQYRAGPGEPWHSVAINHREQTIAETVQEGRVTWWPQTDARRIEIRAQVTDLAGNPAVTHAQLAPSQPDHQTAGASPPTGRSGAPRNDPPSPAEAAIAEPGAVSAGAPLRPVSVSVESDHRGGGGYSKRSGGEIDGDPGEPAWLPPGVRPKMVNSRRFALEYAIDPARSAPGAWIELWGTGDGGQSWNRVAADRTFESPLLAEVAADGLFGFRVLVREGGPGDDPPPQSGDLPEVWIGVDTVPPRVSLVSVAEQEGAGKLVIRWETEGLRLAERPVTILCRATREAPWFTLASGIDDSGRFVWPIDPRAPSQAHFRVEVRDAAGNVGAAETTEAISLNPPRRQARIHDVRPVN